MKHLWIIFLFYYPSLFSQTLLLPNSKYDHADYVQNCQKEGYICITDFIFSHINDLQTPKLDQLFTELDLGDPEQNNNLVKEVKSILLAEFISLDQVGYVQDMLQKSFDLYKDNETKILIKDLFKIKDLIIQHPPESKYRYAIVFKEKIDLNFYKKNKYYFNKVKKILLQTDSFILDQVEQKYVDDFCEKIKLSTPIKEMINDKIYIQSHSEDCHFFKKIATVTESSFNTINEYKTPLVVAAVLGFAIYSFNKRYDVEFK